MPFLLKMPKLSPTMETGVIVKWRVSTGQFVNAGDVLFEVATDKATVEHQAIDEGFLRKVLVEEGKEAAVNQPVAIFTEQKDESIDGVELPAAPAVALPAVPAPAAAPVREEAPVKAADAARASMAQPAFMPEPPLARNAPLLPAEGRIAATPLARKLAREKGLDLSTVAGSGPRGRIQSADLGRAQPDTLAAFGRREEPKAAAGSYEEQKLSPMRRAIGQRLQQAKTFIPHFYVTYAVDAGALVAIHGQLKGEGMKISYNDFVVKASALALRAYPGVNVGYNSANDTLIAFQTIDICIAVSVEGGLITPIVRHADYKNLGQLAAEVKELAGLARAGKLAPEQYKGGSFTLSNLGMFGALEFQAILNPPQAAILAVGGILDAPVVKEGQVVAGKTMNLTLSCDHRVIDGALAAQFLQEVKRLLERPALLLL